MDKQDIINMRKAMGTLPSQSPEKSYSYKNDILCWNCYQKYFSRVGGYNVKGMSLKDALDKVREVHGQTRKGTTYSYGLMGLPRVLIGKKVKLVLVEEDDSQGVGLPGETPGG